MPVTIRAAKAYVSCSQYVQVSRATNGSISDLVPSNRPTNGTVSIVLHYEAVANSAWRTAGAAVRTLRLVRCSKINVTFGQIKLRFGKKDEVTVEDPNAVAAAGDDIDLRLPEGTSVHQRDGAIGISIELKFKYGRDQPHDPAFSCEAVQLLRT